MMGNLRTTGHFITYGFIAIAAQLAFGQDDLQIPPLPSPTIVQPLRAFPPPLPGAPNDFLGTSVSVSGNTVLVTSDSRDHEGEDNGLVYVFDTMGEFSGALFPSAPLNDQGKQARFGFSSSVSQQPDGTTLAIIGATGGDVGGAVYLFDMDRLPDPVSTTPVPEIKKLLPPVGDTIEPFDRYGFSVAIHENRALVGAPGQNSKDGAVYVFDDLSECDPCVATRKIASPEGQGTDAEFGYSVALGDMHVVVGAPGRQRIDGPPEEAGTTYVYEVTDLADPTHILKATPPVQFGDDGAIVLEDSADSYSFGFSVDLDDQRVIVGAPNAGSLSRGRNTGAAYIFDLADPVCTIDQCDAEGQLIASDGMSLDLAGSSVDISGDFALVGAPLARHEETFPGAAYLFEIGDIGAEVDADPQTQVVELTEVRKLIAEPDVTRDPRESIDAFGAAIALRVDGPNEVTVVAGASQEDPVFEGPTTDGGAAWLFDISLPEDAPAAPLTLLARRVRRPLVLQAGDADQDFDFDQLDMIQVIRAGKYLTGQRATWGEGDWNGAPGGRPGIPPAGDGLFNQRDVLAAVSSGTYLRGPYASLAPDGSAGDSQASVGYNSATGELWIDAPAGKDLTSINIDSAANVFTGEAAQGLGGSFDNDSDNNIFKATFGGSFGSLSFGNVAQLGLSREFVLADLSVVGSLAGGGALGEVDLIYVPEPSTIHYVIVALGIAVLCRRRSRNCWNLRHSLVTMLMVAGVALRLNAADPVTNTIELKISNVSYDNLCELGAVSCRPIKNERFVRLFKDATWALRIDPEGVVFAQFDIGVIPDPGVSLDRASYIGVRYLNDYAQVNPPRVVLGDDPQTPEIEALTIQDVQFARNSPLEDPELDVFELLFADATPSLSPTVIKFQTRGSANDRAIVEDVDTGIRRTITQFVPSETVGVQLPLPLVTGGQENDDTFSLVYSQASGNLLFDAASEVATLVIESSKGSFIVDNALNLDGEFDAISANVIFKSVFDPPLNPLGSEFASLDLGPVLPPGLDTGDLIGDLSARVALSGGGLGGAFDLVIVDNPEPSTWLLFALAVITMASRRQRR